MLTASTNPPSQQGTGATPAPSFPRVLDATMLSAERQCPHKFFRRHVQGLVTRRESRSVHLHFGGCFARAMEVARREYATSGDASVAVEKAHVAALAAWGDFPEPDERASYSERKKSLSALLLAVDDYFNTWPLDEDPLRIYMHNGEPCIEFSGAALIPGARHPDGPDADGRDGILYAGRFDMIGEYQRGIWGVDEKTTSVDPSAPSWAAQWKLRSQFTGYTWLAAQYGLRLNGFIVRGVGILKESTRLGFALVPRPQWMVDRWLAQLKMDVAQMCDQYTYWKRRHPDIQLPHPFSQVFDHACADFGGCAYLDLCSSEDPEPWLSEYEVQHWHPLEKRT